MANLLIVDASSSLCSVALVAGSEVLSLEERQPRKHAQRLLPLVDDILSEAGVARQQLDGVAFGRGPGSFTGIRIAISVVQGMALGLELPVLGVSSLEMLASAAVHDPSANSLSNDVQVTAIMNAHMGEVFWGRYVVADGLAALTGEEKVGTPESCHESLTDFNGMVLGNGIPLLSELKGLESDASAEPLARFVAPRVKVAWDAGEFSGIDNHPPVYLRDSVAWKKLDEQPSLLKR